MKNIQIPSELFADLIRFHIFESADEDVQERIRKGLNTKIDALIMRQLYEKYKTAPSEEKRKRARQEYLDRRGIHKDFRW